MCIVATIFKMPKKTRKPKCDIQWVFKDNWATKFPWAKLMVNPNGKVQQVRCKICSIVEDREKLLNLKFDGLQKHLGKRKVLVVHLGVAMGEYYQIF